MAGLDTIQTTRDEEDKMRKVFYKVCAVCVIVGFFGGCGGGGDPASGGVADVNVVDNDSSRSTDAVGPVADSSVPSDEDTGIASDTSVGNDTTAGDTVDYPEPGSVKYWVGIIPGVWEEKPCVDDECTLTFKIQQIPTPDTICPDSDYYIDFGGTGAIGTICLEEKGTLSLCKNNASCGFQASGILEEKIIAHGTCGGKSDNARQCVRSSDCADLVGASQCMGMQVEYWMSFCIFDANTGCIHEDTNKRSFQKVQ